MRVAVVEDEAVVARRIQRLVREILGDRLESLRRLGSVKEARTALAEAPPDVVLLDLNLRGRDGFELLTEAVASSFHTIVVSAHRDRALEAFEHGVLDFVPKPFGAERLRRAFERVEEREAELRERLRWLAVRKGSRVRLVPVEEVVRIEGAGDYAELVCRDGSRHLHAKTLSALERLLPDRFARVHRSAIVDLDEAVALKSEPGSRYFLRLSDGTRVRVGRTRVEGLRARMV